MELDSFKTSLHEEDLSYEIQILKDPNSLDNWFNYINFKMEFHPNDPLKVIPIQLRALKVFDNNSQVWELYLSARIELLDDSKDPIEIKSILNIFNTMIKHIETPTLALYQRYGEFLIKFAKILDSKTIQGHFNWMLKKLKPIDHSIIWSRYLQCLPQIDNKIDLIQRYWLWIWQVSNLELYIPDVWDLNETFEKLCESINQIDQLPIMNSIFEKLVKSDTPKYPIHLCKLKTSIKILKNSNDLSLLQSISNQFNDLIEKFNDKKIELVKLYANVLFQFKSVDFAFEFYELQLNSCNTMIEFTAIFDSYALLVESHCCELLENKGEESKELLIMMNKLDSLLSNRDLLVNDLKLRKNNNCVKYWLERISIFKNDKEKLLDVYSQAVLTINMAKTNEKIQIAKLWCKYSMEYFHLKDYDTCINLFEISLNIPWDDISQKEYIIIGYTNMLIDLNNDLVAGMKLLNRVLESNLPNLDKTFDITKSSKLWSYYIDLSESVKNIDETIRLYERTIDLKIISGVMILNYCEFLIELKLFKKAFSVYERGVEMFSNETKWIISGVYLKNILTNYEISDLSLREVRSIFENCIDNEFNDERQFEFSLLYIKWELTYGSKVKAISILQKIINSTTSQMIKSESFKIIIGLSDGLKSIESVLLESINSISCNTNGFVDNIVSTLAKVETGLHSIFKARQVLKYSSEIVMQFGKSVQLRTAIWSIWKQFELENGDELSYKEMLQFKRLLESISKPVEELKDVKQLNDDVGFVISSKTKHNDNLDEIVNEDAIALEIDDFE